MTDPALPPTSRLERDFGGQALSTLYGVESRSKLKIREANSNNLKNKCYECL